MITKRILCSIIILLPLLVAAKDKSVCNTATECFLLVQKTIESNTLYPASTDGKAYTAVVNFKVDDSFFIFEERITKSSGNKDFDRAVLESVRQTRVLDQLSGLEKSEAQKFTKISLRISR